MDFCNFFFPISQVNFMMFDEDIVTWKKNILYKTQDKQDGELQVKETHQDLRKRVKVGKQRYTKNEASYRRGTGFTRSIKPLYFQEMQGYIYMLKIDGFTYPKEENESLS